METTPIVQPARRLGADILGLLGAHQELERIIFVSAFVNLRTVLRLRQPIMERQARGTAVRFVVGIDLDGTSLNVLSELHDWGCETFVFHNRNPRSTFHPKMYLFEAPDRATLIVGSNNLTEGGLYTNYEVATRFDFDFPADHLEYQSILEPLSIFIDPQGELVRLLDDGLLETLRERGEVPSEIEIRRRRAQRTRPQAREGETIPESPFSAISVGLPPLLPDELRQDERIQFGEPIGADREEAPTPPIEATPDEEGAFERGVLVWKKKLPRTDALQVNEGSHHVGGVRLTQARFENPVGTRIDQTRYFRQLFGDYDWEREPGGRADQEHATVPMRVSILEGDHGVRDFEISHKPSGEAGQANYTTILRWGDLTPTVLENNLTGKWLSLYETDSEPRFLLVISDDEPA